MKERPRILNKILIVGCFTIFLCVALLGIFAFPLFSEKGKPANLNTATNVTQEFLENIKTGNVQLAHSMLSEKFSPSVTVEQFTRLIQKDEDIFKTYHNWEVCDWGVF